MTNFKDKFTNIIAIILVLAGAANTYVQSIGEGEINWFQLGTAIVVALIAYLTGKNPDGKSKSASAIAVNK